MTKQPIQKKIVTLISIKESIELRKKRILSILIKNSFKLLASLWISQKDIFKLIFTIVQLYLVNSQLFIKLLTALNCQIGKNNHAKIIQIKWLSLFYFMEHTKTIYAKSVLRTLLQKIILMFKIVKIQTLILIRASFHLDWSS